RGTDTRRPTARTPMSARRMTRSLPARIVVQRVVPIYNPAVQETTEMPCYRLPPSRRLLIAGAVMFPLIVTVAAQTQRGRGGQAPAGGAARGRSNADDPDADNGRGAAPNPLGRPLLDPNGFVK